MEKKRDGFVGGFFAAAALGSLYGPAGKVYPTCPLCDRPIGTGQGSRHVDGLGQVHGACAQQRDAQREGKDARQGQADGSGDRSGVCPEG